MQIIIGQIILVWNILIILLYGLDKFKAKKGYRRIRETSLIIPAFFLGGPGAMFGMVLFNHKTAKPKFRTLIPLAIILNILAVYLILIKGLSI